MTQERFGLNWRQQSGLGALFKGAAEFDAHCAKAAEQTKFADATKPDAELNALHLRVLVTLVTANQLDPDLEIAIENACLSGTSQSSMPLDDIVDLVATTMREALPEGGAEPVDTPTVRSKLMDAFDMTSDNAEFVDCHHHAMAFLTYCGIVGSGSTSLRPEYHAHWSAQEHFNANQGLPGDRHGVLIDSQPQYDLYLDILQSLRGTGSKPKRVRM